MPRRLLLSTLLLLAAAALLWTRWDPTVEVGLLHSRTGALGDSEGPVLDATKLALQEVNRQGGLLGRRIVWDASETVDCASDAERCAAAAAELLDGGVDTLFGCWSSACRKTVLERLDGTGRDHLLYYPVYYEGLEADEHVVYLGATPNQRSAPAARWARMALGPDAFLVGSDYVYSRAMHQQLKPRWAALRGRILGEAWLNLGDRETTEDTAWLQQQAAAAAAAIAAAQPDVVISTVNGVGNRALMRALQDAGLSADTTPVLAAAYKDAEFADRPDLCVGHYTATTWQAAEPIEANEEFLELWRRHHPDQAVSEPMVAAWSGVQLWAAAVRKAGTFDVDAVREASRGLAVDSPTGLAYLDEGLHAWHGVHVLQLQRDQDYDVVWSEPSPRPPLRWPSVEGVADDDLPRWWTDWLARQRAEHFAGGWQAPTPIQSSDAGGASP
jgi:urea transport system substrate-binding protein